MMGGSESLDLAIAPSGSGENTLVTCERGDYAADLEIAHGVPRAPEFPRRSRAAEVETPGSRRARRSPASSASTSPRRRRRCRSCRREGRAGARRGDDRLDEAKLAAVLGATVGRRSRGDP
jgi:hypothetical protein